MMRDVAAVSSARNETGTMNTLKIGIRLESLGLPFRRALAEAGRLGVTGVEVDAVGDLSPNQLSQTGRREFRHLLRSHNLELTALGCPLRRGLDTAQDQQPRLEHVMKVMALSFDLGPRVVVVEAGPIPEDLASEQARILDDSLRTLGQQGDRIGATLALETGLEAGGVLAAYMRRFDSGALGVNYDPGNLIMHGLDPYESLRALQGLVRHAHAHDGRRVSASRAALEMPVGAGDIDWMQLLATFAEVEYRGWIVVERLAGENRLADIASGVNLLRRLLP
jgi:sugar phosphate isomerase/epimerase